MAINKVVYGNDTLIDLTDTTATASDVASGKSFYAANGVLTSGSGDYVEDVQVNGNSVVSNHTANIVTESAYNSSTNKIATVSDIPTKTSELTNNSGFITKSVNNLTNYELKTDTGHSIELSLNTTTYVMTLNLKNSAGTTISTDTVDLPLESVVVNGSYDSTNKKIILTLESGSTIDIPVGDLISGLQSEITSSNKLSSDLVDDTNKTHKFVTSSEKTTWNGKQDAITSSNKLDYSLLSNTPTIPTVNNGTLTIQKNGSNVSTFTANQSGNSTANITVPTKTSELTNDSNYVVNSSTYLNTHPENNPVIIPFIHNDIAFLLKRGGSAKITYDDVEQTQDISNVFDGSGSYWGINPTGTTTIVIELTLHKVFTWTNTIYCDFGAAGWRSKSINIEVMNTNYSGDTWTSKYSTTTNSSGNVKIQFTHTPVGASNAGGGFNKIRFTFSNWNNATIFRIAQLGVYNYGSQGVRETYMSRGLDDPIYRNITPNDNNTFDLGSSSKKWNTIYATTFNGNATSATKATGDKNGDDITTTYATKTELENFSRNDLAILSSKEYTGLYGSSNDQDGASFYFASVRPTNFYDVWKVKYKVYASVPNQNNYNQYSIVELVGNQDNMSYSSFNRLYSTSYRSYLYHNFYRLNSTGYNAGYSHTLGVGLRNATNPTSSSYPRTLKIELLETENCEVTLFDSAIKRTSVSGQGSTNFAGVTEINGGDNGLQETGDNTLPHQLRHNNGNYIASTNLYRYEILFTKNETTLIPVNAVNNSTATNKTLTTEEFDPFGHIMYYNSTTNVNANASITGNQLYYQLNIDLRYSFNTGTTLTNNRAVYLVAVPQSNGKAKLHSTPITQTLPSTEDNLIYIYLGHASSNYQMELSYRHPIYEYKNGAIRQYTNANINNLVTIDDVYPVGSIYMTMAHTNPNVLFNGTWELFGQGKVLVGVDTNDSDFDSAEKTGGSKTHTHKETNRYTSTYSSSNGNAYTNGGTVANTDIYTSASSSLPPYITCYMWKRTA